MEEKKIIYKSIDEQLAEEEAKERASAASKQTVKIDEKSTGKAVARTVAGPKKGKKKLRMKKSVRRTVGSLLLATSLVVAAVPVGDVVAVTEDNEDVTYFNDTPYEVPSYDTIIADSEHEFVKESDTTVEAKSSTGMESDYGYQISLIDYVDTEGNPAKQADARVINGISFTVIRTDGYQSPDELAPLFKMAKDNEGKIGIDEYLNPSVFGKDLVLDGFWGYSKDLGDEDNYNKLERFTEDGETHRYVVEKIKKDSNNLWYKAYKERLVTPTDTTLEVQEAVDTETDTEQTPDSLDESLPSNNPEPTETPTPDPTPTPTPDPEQTESPVQDEEEINTPPVTNNESEPDETKTVDIDNAGTAGFDLRGTLMVADEDPTPDPTPTPPPEQWDPIPNTTIMLCTGNSTYNRLCNNSFVNIPGAMQISIPSTSLIDKIGNSAFENTGLGKIDLSGSKLFSIGHKCFAHCDQLDTLTLGGSITTIGDGAFADDVQIKEIHLPGKSSKIGSAAFYHCSISNLDISQCNNVKVGDFAFANNDQLKNVDLAYNVGGLHNVNTIGNLSDVQYLFAGCTNLEGVALPENFDGKLQPETFRNCTNIKTFIVRDKDSDFTAGEFRKDGFKIYGPDPEDTMPEKVYPYSGNSDMNPDNDGPYKTYNTCLKWDESGVKSLSYDYTYVGCSSIGYKGTATMPDLTEAHNYCNHYIKYTDPSKKVKVYPQTVMQLDGRFVSRVFERSGGPSSTYELVINGGVGGVEPNYKYEIDGINADVFRQDGKLNSVKIGDRDLKNTYALKYLGANAFSNCSELSKVFVNVNETTISKECFANNDKLYDVELGRAGTTPSSIGEGAFSNCGDPSDVSKLFTVRFINDDLRGGSEEGYAVIGSIGKDAFLNSSRENSIFFIGPMDRKLDFYNYAVGNPEKGQAPAQIGSGNSYVRYKSGNPTNLECQYDKNDGKIHLLSYPNMTSVLGTDPNFVKGDPPVLVEMTPRKIKEYSDADPDSTTALEDRCYDCAKDIIIPEGIDSIDKAKSYINLMDTVCTETDPKYYAIHPMYKADAKTYFPYKEATGDYTGEAPTETDVSTGHKDEHYYEQFKYVKDLHSVTFVGPQVFPDRMFEGSTDLEIVNFNKDVIDLGDLPFYLPDTEGDNSLGHVNRSPSKVYQVNFNAETDASVGNVKYYGSNSSLNQMIVSEIVTDLGGEKTAKTVCLEQILPLRGVPRDLGNEKYHDGDEIFSISEINAVVASGIDEIKENAARDCDNLINIQLNDATKSLIVRKNAFYDCDNLANIYFPDQVTQVEKDAFGRINNKHLNIYVPSRDTTFEPGAFYPTNGEHYYPEAYIYGPDDEKAISKYTQYVNDASGMNFNVHFDVDPDLNKPWVKFIIGTKEVYKIQIDNGTNVETIVKKTVDPQYNPDGKYKWVGNDLVTGEDDISISENLKHDTNFYAEEVKTYTVSFRYKDGTEILKTTVTDGQKIPDDILSSAITMAKSVEPVDGKYFSGWDKPTGNAVIEDMIITAQYNKNGEKYTVSVYLNSITPDNRLWYKEFPYKNSYLFTKALRDDLMNNTLTQTKIIDGVTMTFNGTKNDSIPLEDEPITESLEIIAIYTIGSSTSTPSSSSSKSTTSKSTTSKSSSSHTSSSSSSKSSSSSSSSAYPVFVNSQEAGAAPGAVGGIGSTVYLGDGSGSGGSGGSGSGGNKGSGNTTVVSTTGGISDPSKITATVNGSSDNYVIKITQTQEADEMGLAALHSAYGEDISPIRYLPFDISLYDSTGTNKISPVPEGMSVSLTMPIPDDLAIYGGNAKIACTTGGQLDKLQPRFTVINGVPCMTFTCTHLSPYMIYVDTANLTEAGIADATPKTADGIHPKWFLCFGLAAIAIVLFLKKDPEEYIKKAAA